MVGKAPEELLVKLRARPADRLGEGTRSKRFPLASFLHTVAGLGFSGGDENRDGCLVLTTPEFILDTVVVDVRHRPFFNFVVVDVVGHSCYQ